MSLEDNLHLKNQLLLSLLPPCALPEHSALNSVFILTRTLCLPGWVCPSHQSVSFMNIEPLSVLSVSAAPSPKWEHSGICYVIL